MGQAAAKELKELKEALGGDMSKVYVDNTALLTMLHEMKGVCKEANQTKEDGFNMPQFLKLVNLIVLERHAVPNANNAFFRVKLLF